LKRDGTPRPGYIRQEKGHQSKGTRNGRCTAYYVENKSSDPCSRAVKTQHGKSWGVNGGRCTDKKATVHWQKRTTGPNGNAAWVGVKNNPSKKRREGSVLFTVDINKEGGKRNSVAEKTEGSTTAMYKKKKYGN